MSFQLLTSLFPCLKRQTAADVERGGLQAHSSKQGEQVLDAWWVSLRSLLHTFSTRFTFTLVEPSPENSPLYSKYFSTAREFRHKLIFNDKLTKIAKTNAARSEKH